MSNQFGFVRFGVADLTHIGIVRFGEADYKQLLSNFILIATLAIILYVALFVNDDNSEESKIPKPKGLISPVKKQAHAAVNESKDEDSDASEEVYRQTTPKKTTPRKKQVELGHVTSPEGRRLSIRLRTKTPAKQ